MSLPNKTLSKSIPGDVDELNSKDEIIVDSPTKLLKNGKVEPATNEEQIKQDTKQIEENGKVEPPTNEEQIKQYTKQIEKLSSIGPLNITDLTEFLDKSKIDFQYLYRDKTISDLKITDFKYIKKLGKGAFGKVILVEYEQDDRFYAIKIIDKKQVVRRKHFHYVNNEKRILRAMNFPFVIYLKYFFVDFQHLYFVMPFVPGGDFYNYLKENKPLSEVDAMFYTGQLVLALEYLNYLELIHRDVKPENIIMDAFGYLKLADFGQCLRSPANEKTWTLTGTPEYMAPEIIVGSGYNCAVDWWSLGVVVFEICAGHRPFKHENTNRLYKLILSVKYDVPQHFSRHLRTFINLLIVGVPSKRNYCKGANRIKSHAWLKNTDWLALLNRTVKAPYLPDLSKNKINIKL